MIRGAKSIPPTAGDAALRVTLVACLFYAAFGAFLQWFPVWLIDARGFTGGQLGLAIAWAGIGAAPCESMPAALAAAAFVPRRPAGRGAVREVCEQILRARGLTFTT